MCFVDLEKAFNPVISEVLWELLWEYGYETAGPNTRFDTFSIIKDIYFTWKIEIKEIK